MTFMNTLFSMFFKNNCFMTKIIHPCQWNVMTDLCDRSGRWRSSRLLGRQADGRRRRPTWRHGKAIWRLGRRFWLGWIVEFVQLEWRQFWEFWLRMCLTNSMFHFSVGLVGGAAVGYMAGRMMGGPHFGGGWGSGWGGGWGGSWSSCSWSGGSFGSFGSFD